MRGTLAINHSYDESDDEHDAQWLDRDAHAQAAETLARWAAEYAAAKPTGAKLVAAITALEDAELSEELDRAIVFAEDGVRAVLGAMGFASLDETVFGG